MNKKFLFILLLGAVNFLSCMSSPALPENPDKPKTKNKYFRLSFVVPSSFCRKEKCRQHPKELVLDGLFPVEFESDGTNTFQDAMLLRHKDDLLAYWPYLLGRKDDFHFYHYENFYKQYGVKCNSMFTMDEYFSTATRLTKIHSGKIYKALVDNGIVPNKAHSLRAIREAIRKYTYHESIITCQRVGERMYLYEIIVCLDEFAELVIDCVGKRKNECKNFHRIFFPQL